MAKPLLMKVEDALVLMLQGNSTIASLVVSMPDGTESPLQILPSMTATGMEDSRIECSADEASSSTDRVRSGNFSVTVNVRIVTAVAEASVPSDGTDANQDGVDDAPRMTVDMVTLRDRHGERCAAVSDVFRIDTLPEDFSATTVGLGAYGHSFNGERQTVQGPFLIYTVSYILHGVCETDL